MLRLTNQFDLILAEPLTFALDGAQFIMETLPRLPSAIGLYCEAVRPSSLGLTLDIDRKW